MHCHDCTTAHHDKDYRCFVIFKCAELADKVVQVWRVDRWGKLVICHLVGERADAQAEPAFAVLVHQGHMRLLAAPRTGAAGALYRHWYHTGHTVREQPANPWEAFLSDAEGAAPLVAARRESCRRCQENQVDIVEEKVGHRAATQPNAPGRGVANSGGTETLPLDRKPTFAWGLVYLLGEGADASTREACREHGVLWPGDAREEELMSRARDPPGPGHPNMWHLRINFHTFGNATDTRGKRTHEHPEGQGSQEEREENEKAQFLCQLAETLEDNGRAYVIEEVASPPGRRYRPHFWELPCWQQLHDRGLAKLVTINPGRGGVNDRLTWVISP